MSTSPTDNDSPTFWDFLQALSDLDEYVGRQNPVTKELEIRHRSDLPAGAIVIDRARAHTVTQECETEQSK